jgi:hypothetical protein
VKRLRRGYLEIGLLAAILVAQAVLFARPLHSATNYDEDVYLAALDALRHGQALGSQVFAAQFPGFYDLLRGLSYLTGIGVAPVRAGLLGVLLLGTIGAWLVGRRFGGTEGGLLSAAFLTIAPPLDLFGYQVIADTPALALTALALGLATLPGTIAAVTAGCIFGAALSVKLTALTAAPALVWLLRQRLRAAAVGFTAVVGVLLLAHARALGALWTSGVTYHDKARSTPAVIPHPYHQIVDQIPRSTPFFWLAVAAVVTAIAFAAMRRSLGTWPLWSWVVLGLLFLLAHKPLHYNHLVEFPFALAVASGATLGSATHRMRPEAGLIVAVAVTAAVVGAFVQQWHRVAIAVTPEPQSNVAAARALSGLTRPGDLTVDDRPIISFQARRRVVGSLVDLALLRFQTNSLTDGEVISKLPLAKAVVVSRTLRSRPRILDYVRAHLKRRYDAGGVAIWVAER